MSIIDKLRLWVVRGALDCLLPKYHTRKISRVFLRNARQFPCQAPNSGIKVLGPISDQGSLCKVLRDCCFSLCVL